MFLNARDFTYDLPEHRIASTPAAQRDKSKLLVFDSGEIEHRTFSEISEFLPSNSVLVLNETRVLHARLFMQKETGGKVQVMCLEPILPATDPAVALATTSETMWRCMLGGKRIREGQTLVLDTSEHGAVTATLSNQQANYFDVEFKWTSGSTFAEILEAHGNIPIPPYMRREANEEDTHRYQTVYAEELGSVAAPTAGLHFTRKVFEQISNKSIDVVRVALHVGAGTFVPISSENVGDHTMHTEKIVVSNESIRELVDALNKGAPITAVGTTSVRTLESLYWLGVKLIARKTHNTLNQWEPYQQLMALSATISAQEALAALADLQQSIVAETQLMIVPGYTFKIVDNMVTNFHQPGSTLLCLVAAFVGEKWRDMYTEALSNDYRFLSYGDSSLLIGQRH